MSNGSDRIITRGELAKHNNQKDGRWILIGNDVLDISTFHGTSSFRIRLTRLIYEIKLIYEQKQ